MIDKTLHQSQSHQTIPMSDGDNHNIAVDDILCQISQQEDLQDEQEQNQNDKTSFVQDMSQKLPQKEKDNKKQKFSKYLVQRRQSLPTLRKKDISLQDQLSSIQNQQLVKKQSQEFILKFNNKPSQAVQFLMKRFQKDENEQKMVIKEVSERCENDEDSDMDKSQNFNASTMKIQKMASKNQSTQKKIARYLLCMEGLDKTVLGQYFGKNNEKVLKILHEFCCLLDFQNMEFDLALRKLLSKFRLPGQSQQIQRVIWQFSLSFYEQNKKTFDNADELFPLAYSIIMLATDAHNPKQQRKMTVEQFVRNTQRPCPSISKPYLQHIYDRITKSKLETEFNNWEFTYARLRDMNNLKLKDYLKNTDQIKKGLVMLKACRDGAKLPFSGPKQSKFVQRKVFLSQDETRINWISDPAKGQEQPRFIQIADIVDLTLGIDPQLVKQKKVPIEFDSVFFTITTKYRCLNLKAKNTKERSLWLNYLRAIMIKRRQQRIQEYENKEKTMLSDKALQEAWNRDIFPHWDRYWDYNLKKPKKKGYFTRGMQAICGCFQSTSQNVQNQVDQHYQLGITIKNNLLETLWKYGLPPSSRKTLWIEMIGNSLQLNKIMIDDIKRRKIHSQKLRIHKLDMVKEFLDANPQLKAEYQEDIAVRTSVNDKVEKIQEVIFDMTEFLITLRPDLPHVKDLLYMSKVFHDIFKEDESKIPGSQGNLIIEKKIVSRPIPKRKNRESYQSQKTYQTQNKQNQLHDRLSNRRRKHVSPPSIANNPSQILLQNQSSLIALANLIHRHHFFSFFRGQVHQINARIQLFDYLMEINTKNVLNHFKAIKLETRMYLMSWFLSVFAGCFEGEFLWRIWDNFLIQEEVYLFKVGIAIVKYYETQLKMCTFSEGLDLLKKPPQTSPALFFHILQNEINVTSDHYHYYIEKRKHAMIKAKVQLIPLE